MRSKCMWALRRVFGTRKVLALIAVLAATLRSQPCTLVSALMLLLSGILSLLQLPSNGSYKTKSDPVTWLLKTSRWLPITLKVNFRFLNMAYHVLHDLDRTLLPSLHSNPHLRWLYPLLLSLQLSARHHLPWEDRLSPPEPENSPSSPCPTTLPLTLSLHTYLLLGGVWVLLAFICIALFL